jgi:hypothetical protein
MSPFILTAPSILADGELVKEINWQKVRCGAEAVKRRSETKHMEQACGFSCSTMGKIGSVEISMEDLRRYELCYSYIASNILVHSRQIWQLCIRLLDVPERRNELRKMVKYVV